jgi:hypothetical protein
MKMLVLTAAAAAVLGAPAQAQAEGFFTPFAGVNFGNQPVEGNPGSFGFSTGYMGAGVIGGEFDFGYSPDIFDEAVDNYALTFMGNMIIGIPIGGTSGGGVRPYVTGGGGLIRTRHDGFANISGVTTNDFGFNVGGGLMGFFSDHVGLRGELRYFRNLTSDLNDSDNDLELGLGDVDFWRATLGLIVRLGADRTPD